MKASFLVPLLVTFGAAVGAAVDADRIDYEGYKVFRLAVGNNATQLSDLINSLSLSTWKGVPKAGHSSDIVVPPPKLEAFEQGTGGFDTEVLHDNLGASIQAESDFEVYAAGSANSTWFNSYHSYADHLQFLRDLQSSYPSNSEIVSAGRTVAGNTITGIHFYGSGGKGKKPAVVFHGTVHAREWITTMVVEYMAFNLLTNYASNAEIKSFVDKYDFYIFPILTAAGFLYTQSNDRLWRKNRQTNSASSCLGRDINRNWPYEWSVTGGASTNPCAEDYKGQAAADAPETQVLYKYIDSVKAAQGVKLFIDWHSYSQLFMTPYGYSCNVVASNNAELQSLASGFASSVRAVYGTSFKTGPICTTIYPATGCSVDYVDAVTNADYTFTTELRDTGNYGFVLPANQIQPSSVEAYAGVRYLLLNMN
ncbi:MAG: hypothetical protein Q9227_002973 [Pyrenula ochraceoflavens]